MKKFIPLLVAFLLTFAVFWQFFVKGFVPAPFSFMVAWYEPWKSDTVRDGVPTIAHKPVGDDVFRQIIPFKMLATNIIRQAELPLWNPFGGSGQPLMANLHPGYLNPLSLLLLLPKHLGWSLFVILQLPALFLAAYWYATSLKISQLGSIFASCVLTLSGVVIARTIYGDYVWALVTLPILLGLIERNDKKMLTLFFPVTIFFLLVSVQPQISLYVLVTVFLYAFLRRVHVLYYTLLGFGFATIQLLPTLELLKHANVTSDASAFIFQKFLLPFSHVISLLIPNYFGNSGTYNFWGKTDYVETVIAVGSIPVFLSLFAPKNNPVVRFFSYATLINVLLTFDWLVPQLLYQLPLPVLSTSIPSRVYLLTTFFIAMLAGFGIDSLEKNKKLLAKFWIVLLGILVYTAIASVEHYKCPDQVMQCRLVALRTTGIELAVFFLFTILFFLKNKTVIALGAIALVLGIGLYNSQKFLPMSPPEYFMPDHPKLAELRNKPFIRTNTDIATDLSSYYGFFDPNYYDPLYIKRYGEFVAYGNGSEVTRSDVIVSPNKRLFTLLSVGPEGLPHAYMVYRYETPTDPLQRLFDPTFDASNSAVLEEAIGASFTQGNSRVTVTQYGTADVRMQVHTDSDGLLVFTDNYYPGWNAYVDGTKTKLYRANYTFRGVVVPKGEHKVEMRYEPDSVKYGVVLTVVSIIAWLILLLQKRKLSG